jgi:RimJ/RimL family protein N-acetyltransferase
MVEAVLLGRREEAERLARARMPERWPNPELVERAFAMPLERIRAESTSRLWGARVMIAVPPAGRDPPDQPGAGRDPPDQPGAGRDPPDKPGAEKSDRRVVGSIVFRGEPDELGIAEIAYGVEEQSQGQGYATEAVRASVAWALGHPTGVVKAVQAATFAWHRASVRVLEKVGMTVIGLRDHETMGEMVVYERRLMP